MQMSRPLMPRRILALAAGLSLLTALPAVAEDVIYGPDGAPTVVQHKRYPMTGRWETGVLLSAGLNDALTEHYGVVLQQRYHPNEWLDFGVDGLFNYTALSSLVDQIREKLPPRQDSATQRGNIADELNNASQLRYGVVGAIRLAPIYGKLDLASEVALHFQAFAMLGAGAGFVHHESVNLCATAGSGACQPGQFQVDDSLKPLGQIGVGLRFWTGQHVTLEAQLRANVYPDSYKQLNDLTKPGSGVGTTYLAVLTTLLAGVSVVY